MAPEYLAWPLAVTIIAIAALLIFRPALLRLIDRTSRASKDGFTFDRPQEEGETPKPLSFEELMNLPMSTSALEREQVIKKQLQEFNLSGEKEQISVLTRILATTRVESEFSRIAHIIYGSQLEFLVHLSGKHSGATMSVASSFFEKAKESFPDLHSPHAVDEWLKFLYDAGLITEKERVIDITQFGTDFLKYLVDSRQTYQRYG